VTSDDARPPVDLDQIADYVDGLLTRDDAAVVERRIADDPRWAAAAAALRTAGPLVSARLRDAGSTAEPMPDDVAARILGALPTTGSQPPSAVVVSLDRRRRRFKWAPAARLAAAAVVIAGLALGVNAVVGNSSSRESATSSAGNGASATRAPDSVQPQLGLPMAASASGHDYADQLRSVFGQPGNPPTKQPLGATAGGESGATGRPLVATVPPGLEPLNNEPALRACLAALSAHYQVTAPAVDFAYYRGKPAVVIVSAGQPVAAVGPACGVPGHGADILAEKP
jgi:anti-sigma factor RsiW